MEERSVIFIDIPVSKSRSVSPMSPSPCRERNLGFFEILSRRFGRRSHDELCFQHNGEEDSRSSSTDSYSSTSGHLVITPKNAHNSNLELACSNSDSSSSSSTSSTSDSNDNTNRSTRMHRRSTSSIRRALETFSISSRSLSCSSTPSKEQKQKKNKKSPPPKRILRQPVSYTYLKGMSGLPTQRVPRSSVCSHYSHR